MNIGSVGLNNTLNVNTLTAAGTVQADATAIGTKSMVFVLAAGNDTVGIKLPAASPGKFIIVKNTGAGGLKVWPSTGDAINAVGANNALTMATVTSAIFVASSTSQWYTVPLLPS
jgi:hypothetical protein